MKKNNLVILMLLSFLSVMATSCQAIEGIFKAGVWVGILFVVGIIALIIFIISRLGGRK